eukprot:6210355-Pleurochrysis_carterae.AAC.1
MKRLSSEPTILCRGHPGRDEHRSNAVDLNVATFFIPINAYFAAFVPAASSAATALTLQLAAWRMRIKSNLAHPRRRL